MYMENYKNEPPGITFIFFCVPYRVILLYINMYYHLQRSQTVQTEGEREWELRISFDVMEMSVKWRCLSHNGPLFFAKVYIIILINIIVK